MRFPFRRHRGSQTLDTGFIVAFPDGRHLSPNDAARELCAAIGHPVPARRTARQVLTETLLRDVVLADHYDRVPALVDGILLNLDAAGLEIVASGDVE